ncbi:MAG: AMP-binding protein [Magnetococcales bacterium]|nr:AMP-binding protein [Magnetococcales bacterium]
MSHSITDALQDHGRRTPEKIFCHLFQEDKNTSLTYGVLLERAQAFAGLYQAHGALPGEVIPIFLPHGMDLYPAFLGAMLAGCVPSFMPPLTVKQEPEIYWEVHRKLLKRIGARLVVADRRLADHVDKLDFGDGTILQPQQAGRISHPTLPVAIGPDDVAFLQHSSGTTGLKKGVVLTHRAVLRQAAVYGRAVDLTPDAVVASWLPLYHDMGLLACFIIPLLVGASMVSLDPFAWVIRPESLFAAVELHRATHVWLPNFAFHHLCRTVDPSRSPYDLSSLKAIINCSEPCKAETFALFAHTFASCGVSREKLQISYAMAETVFASTQTPLGKVVLPLAVDQQTLVEKRCFHPPQPARPVHHLMPVGPILEGLEMRIVEGDTVLADGQVGEVAMRGDFLFTGYFKQPELSAERIRNGWYHSGDLGFIWGGGLYITGRKDDLLIIHGKNIHAHDVEQALNQVVGIKAGRAVAVARFDPLLGSHELIVIAETDATAPELHKKIKKEVAGILAALFNITSAKIRLVAQGWLVKTTSGKISRERNLAKLLQKTALVILLLTTLLLWFSPSLARAESGTSACNWFGLTLGYKDVAWNEILGKGQVEQAIHKHCHTIYCGHEPRMHHSMVYEIMPCDHRCVVVNRRYFQDSCF